MAKYLANAFSLQMLVGDHNDLSVDVIKPEDVDQEDLISTLGHEDIANVVSKILGNKYEVNRVSNKVVPGDILYAAQFMGGRLPEGATSLPENMEVKFFKVVVNN